MPSPLDALDSGDREKAERRIRKHVLRVRLVWAALVLSLTFVAAGASWAVTTGFLGRPLASLPDPVTWAVGLYVLGSLVAARLLARRLLRGTAPGAGAEAVFQSHFGAVVVGMALREGAGILGAVWGALIGSLQWVVILALPPLLAMIVAWPRRADVVRLLDSGTRDPPSGGTGTGEDPAPGGSRGR